MNEADRYMAAVRGLDGPVTVAGRVKRIIPLVIGLAFVLSGCGRDGLSFLFPSGILAAAVAMLIVVVGPETYR